MLVHLTVLITYATEKVQAFPNVCTAIDTPAFQGCLGLSIGSAMCGWPVPRPCARISYYVPETFMESVANPKESYFSDMPGAAAQLSALSSDLPFGFDDDNGAYSFEAHTASVPFVSIPFNMLPCGGAPIDNLCFSAMSEHLGKHWKIGDADHLQPAYLAWSLAPKACLVKGAIDSMSGGGNQSSEFNGAPVCSFDHHWIPQYPPSEQPVCNGWGIVYPRYGTVTNSDPTTAALMIALRIKSLGTEVFRSVPRHHDEKWQMIYPQPSACFREGENVALLQAKGLNELGRLQGRMKNYLYVTWKKVSCKRDWPTVPAVYASVSLMSGVCSGMPK